MKLSIIILTWNNYNTLVESIYNIAQDLQGIEREVIIVDNGSNDGCEELATIKNKENRGVSIGKNQGIEKANGDYLFFLDGDIVPVPNSIRLLIAYLDEHPECEAIGFYPNKFTNQKNTEDRLYHEKYCHQLFEPKVYTTSNLYYGIMRKSIFDKGLRLITGGPFDGPGYGWEERDFFMQMQQAGIKQWVCGLNSAIGKYYHAINSSIKMMGHDKYVESSKKRKKVFDERWKTCLINI